MIKYALPQESTSVESIINKDASASHYAASGEKKAQRPIYDSHVNRQQTLFYYYYFLTWLI